MKQIVSPSPSSTLRRGHASLRWRTVPSALLLAACTQHVDVGAIGDGKAAGDAGPNDAAPIGTSQSSAWNIVPLAPGRASAVASDSAFVYWTDPTAGTVSKIGADGGTVVTLAIGQASANAIAVDGTSVYWTTGIPGTGAVKKVDLNGGDVTTLASSQDSPSGIAVNDRGVYWTCLNYGDAGAPFVLSGGPYPPPPVTNLLGAVLRLSPDGGAPITVASGLAAPGAIALDSTSAYWTASWQLRGTDVLEWKGQIQSSSADGMIPATYTSLDGSPTRKTIAVAAGSLLFSGVTEQMMNGTFRGPPLAVAVEAPLGGGASVNLDSGPAVTQGMTANETGVYWARQADTDAGSTVTLDTVGPSGGTATTVALGVGSATGIAAIGSSAYVGGSLGSAAIVKVSPK